MRIESKNKVSIGDTVIGGLDPLVCIPLIDRDRSRLLSQAKELSVILPDLIEWRVDALEGLGDEVDWLELLGEIRSICSNIPLLFTCRSHLEGGLQELAPKVRQAIIIRAIASGLVDIVDIEMCSGEAFINEVRQTAKEFGIHLIFSYHNFTSTPPEDFLVEQLVKAEELGADIGKVAVMPKSYNDVLTLLQASLRARSGPVNIPLVTISMGETGVISRVAGGLFGSDITFAAGSLSSAPGQVGIQELRRSMELFYRKST